METNKTTIEHTNGDKFWYVNNKLHRTDGPAIEWNDGAKDWYINGEYIGSSVCLTIITIILA